MDELSSAERLRRNLVLRQLLHRLSQRSENEGLHASRVAVYSVAIGGALEMSAEDLLSLRYAGALHDIGKLRWPDRLLSVESDLSDVDRKLIRSHPIKGAQEIGQISWFKGAQPGILYHHERWDGSGYPLGLSGEAIPLFARIIAVAEVFDCLTMSNGWRGNVPEREALDTIRSLSGLSFDPKVVEAFSRVQPIIQPIGL